MSAENRRDAEAQRLAELTGKIIGVCIDVHRAAGPGLLESAYKAMVVTGLKAAGLKVRSEVALPLEYLGVRVSAGYRIDVLVEECVILELKSVEKLLPVHDAQLLTYLKLSGLSVGLLLNFNVPVLKDGIRRLVNNHPEASAPPRLSGGQLRVGQNHLQDAQADSSEGVRQKLLTAADLGAARLAANPKVAAILLAGSVAQGDVDAASDIDLIVYLHEAFTPAEHEAEVAAAKASGGGVHFGDSGAGFGVYHYIGGRKVDFGIGLCSATDELLDALLLKHDPNPTYQLVARGILHGRALHGPEVIARWQARLRDYPDGLALATVKHCARFMPAWVLREMGAKRDDAFLVYEHALQAVSGLCGIVAALNRQYHPGKVKRLAHFAAGLNIAPREFGVRARSVFGGPLPQAVETLEALVRETLALVQQHMPGFDLVPVLQRYNAKLVRDE